MHIVMAAVGTEGDVRPFVAVGLALERLGAGAHRVTIATHRDFEAMIRARGLGYRPIGESFKAVVESPRGRAWIESSDDFFRYLRLTKETFTPLATAWVRDAFDAARDADVVVAHPFSLGAASAAEKLGRPSFILSLAPFIPSRELESAFYLSAPRWLRRPLGRMTIRSIGKLFVPHLNEVRTSEGMAPLRSPMFIDHLLERGVPFLHAYSEALVSRPSDWPELSHVTGFCFLPEDGWEPPEALVRFLDGQPPLYIGFGSMTGREPKELAELAIRAARRAGQRAVLVTGWAGARAEGDDVFAIDRVSHDWLLKRVRAVVHHGGAGTTAAGLAAKRPTLIVSFFGDQPYWGNRVFLAGAGPRALKKRDLTEDSLARSIGELVEREDELGARAASLGDAIAQEDGALAAARVILADASTQRPS